MGRRKKRINNSGIPQHELEHIARCILPDILAYYEGVKNGLVLKMVKPFSPCIL